MPLLLSQITFMRSIQDMIKYGFGAKSVPSIMLLSEQTREGLNRSYIPKFLYKPPYGYPRYANMSYTRFLAATPYVEMCIKTILDELTSIEWDIIPHPKLPEGQVVDGEVQHIKSFFENPNTNPESFHDVFVKLPMRDLMEVNSSVHNKIFNLKQEMVELVARDAITFTKNPDIHGMMTKRAEILVPKQIVVNPGEVYNPFQLIPANIVREEAAYFQYGWISGPIPVPFGKREIVWIQDMMRTDDFYGYSPVQVLEKNIQTLIYQIEADLEYFNDNNVPKGIIGLEDSDAEEIKAFKEQWNNQQRKKDEFGNWKKIMNKVPIVNRVPVFTRIEFSASEMQLIEKQKWYTKIVWACFGVTATELGYTEDAQGQANQIVQSQVFKKKAINPKLRLMEQRYNFDVVSEFGYTFDLNGVQVPKYIFKFLIKDSDEDTKKYTLYKLQSTDSGIKTINEIRKEEGLDPVEWGDEDPRMKPQSAVNFGDNFGGDRTIPQIEKEGEPPKKPTGAEDPNKTKKKTEKELEGTAKKKAKSTENPLILKEGETPSDPKRLRDAILFILKEDKELIMDLIDKEVNREMVLSEIKGADYSSFDDCVSKNKDKSDPEAYCAVIMRKIEGKGINEILNKVVSLLSASAVRDIAYTVIKSNFLNGWDDAEKQMDRNFVPDRAAIDYIANYTFENIKDVTDDTADKLRGELQRAFMNGEGTDAIKNRVDKIFDTAANRAETIARTETSRAVSFGKLGAWKASGLDAKKWLLWTDDNRTSEVTKALHKKYGSAQQAIPLDENFKATVVVGKKKKTVIIIDQQAPPFHPNERDSLMFTLGD